MTSQTELIIERARAIKLPTMVGDRGGVVKGALAGYGESYYAIGRLAAKHVQRISLGTSPGDLAVEQVDKLHLAVNLKVARELGVTIPHALLSRADEVIE